MERSPGLGYDSHRITVEILLVDADLALTFTEVATSRRDPKAKARTVQNARKAYNYISERRHSVLMEQEDAVDLDGKLRLLKKRLTELGEHFDPESG